VLRVGSGEPLGGEGDEGALVLHRLDAHRGRQWGHLAAQPRDIATALGASAVEGVYPSRLKLPAKVRLFVDAMAALAKPMVPPRGGSRRRRS
jgi:hypothetical protein